jgi:hypothetical protein
MGKGSDFNPGFSFDFGADAPSQAAWEFSGEASTSSTLSLCPRSAAGAQPQFPLLPAARPLV